jgi:aryl-alcohol dehydrogenase-like predicted oxidoreductase
MSFGIGGGHLDGPFRGVDTVNPGSTELGRDYGEDPRPTADVDDDASRLKIKGIGKQRRDSAGSESGLAYLEIHRTETAFPYDRFSRHDRTIAAPKAIQKGVRRLGPRLRLMDQIPHSLLAPGVEVTEVGLGLWAVAGSAWGPGDDKDSLEAIETALELGVNFFDTADVYGGGHSEELLGRAMRERRDRFTVATKIGWTGFDQERRRSQYDTVDKLIAGVRGSLARMESDRVEVIQCHIGYLEPNTPVFIEAFRKMKEDGLVRAWGVSTGDIHVLETFNADGDCDVLQTDYSILNRTAERELLPYCQENAIGVIVRGPLAMGLLADKFGSSDTFPADDFRQAWIEDKAQNEQYRQDLEVVAALRDVVPDHETMAQFALRFVRSHPTVTTVIPGARDREQSASNSRAGMAPHLSNEEMAGVDRLVPPGGGRKVWPA